MLLRYPCPVKPQLWTGQHTHCSTGWFVGGKPFTSSCRAPGDFWWSLSRIQLIESGSHPSSWKLLESDRGVTIQIPLVQHLLVLPGCEGKDVGCAVLSKLLTAVCCVRTKSCVSLLGGDGGEGSLPIAEPAQCRDLVEDLQEEPADELCHNVW